MNNNDTNSHCRDETDTFTTFRCTECNCETDVKVPSSVDVSGTEKEMNGDKC